MRKLFLLYQNEMIKMLKKVSIIVLLVLMVAATIISSIVINKENDILNSIESFEVDSETKAQIQENISLTSDKLQQENKRIANDLVSMSAGYTKTMAQSQLEYNTRVLDIIALAEKNDISIEVADSASEDNTVSETTAYGNLTWIYISYVTNNNSFIYNAISEMISYNSSIYDAMVSLGTGSIKTSAEDEKQTSLVEGDFMTSLFSGGSSEKITQKTVDDYKKSYEKRKEAVENNNYATYIEICNEELAENRTQDGGMNIGSEEERNIEIEMNNLRLKADPSGEKISDLSETITWIKLRKKSLLYNKDMTSLTLSNTPLSAEKREEMENKLDISMYKLENGISSSDDDVSKVTESFSYGQTFIIILVLLLAGSSISHEMSKGSIKSLIIAPAKRWKIFAAKYLSVLTVGLIGMLLTYIVSILMNIIFNGINITPYVFILGNSIVEMNGYLFHLLYDLVQFLDVVIYSAFAFMLSIVTRNTALSVAASLGTYFAGTIFKLVQVVSLIDVMSTGSKAVAEWKNFIPFNNMANSLMKYVFPYLEDKSLTGIIGMVETSQTIWFILGYMIVLLVCMLYTGFDSFTRRDIK